MKILTTLLLQSFEVAFQSGTEPGIRQAICNRLTWIRHLSIWEPRVYRWTTTAVWLFPIYCNAGENTRQRIHSAHDTKVELTSLRLLAASGSCSNATTPSKVLFGENAITGCSIDLRSAVTL